MTKRCPLETHYNPLRNPHRDNPFDFYSWAREPAPVHYAPELGVWMVSRYDDIRYIVRDPIVFSSKGSIPTPEDLNPPEILDYFTNRPGLARTVTVQDSPEHDHQRLLWQHALRGSVVNTFYPPIRALSTELLEPLTRALRSGTADISSLYTRPFAAGVIGLILGLGTDELHQIKRWMDDLIVLLQPWPDLETRRAAARSMPAFYDFMVKLFQQRRRELGTDIISTLIKDNPTVADEDLVEVFKGSVGAGIDTTRAALDSALHLMLTNNMWVQASAAPAIIPNLVMVTLRREAPHCGSIRTVTQDTHMAGTDLPAGSVLLLLYGSGNVDNNHFDKPMTFDPDRPHLSHHLAFGGGPHYCVGAHLARSACRIAVETLTAHLPGLRTAPTHHSEYDASWFFRQLTRLDVQHSNALPQEIRPRPHAKFHT